MLDMAEVMNVSLIKKPSAFPPIAMSLAALTIVLVHITFVGTPQADSWLACYPLGETCSVT